MGNKGQPKGHPKRQKQKKSFILIAGAMRSGKDTLANFLTEAYPDTFVKISLADSLKEMEANLRELYSDLAIESLYESMSPDIDRCLISAKMRSYFKKVKAGKILQHLGTEIVRKIDDLAFVKLLSERAKKVRQPVIVVPDCRFRNEFFSQELLPGTRLICYADNETIQKRLDAVGDTRKLWEHESEKMAFDFYYDINKSVDSMWVNLNESWTTARIAAEWAEIKGIKLFNTTNLSMSKYRLAVLGWAKSFLKCNDDIRPRNK